MDNSDLELGLPFKVAFFLWRVWKRTVATDDNIQRMRIQIVPRFYCCERKDKKTMEHVFQIAPISLEL